MLLWGWTDLGDRIRSGDVVSDLLRPVHPVTSYLAVDLGRAGYASLTRFTVPIVVGAIFFDLYVPVRWSTYPLYVLSMVLAVVVSFGFRFLINACGYWLLDLRGVLLISAFATSALTGLAFPLHFLPDWLAATAWVATPFPSMLQAPLDVLVEYGSAGYSLAVVAGQAAWVAILLALCRYVQRRAERKLVIQGGSSRLATYRHLLGAQLRGQASYRTSFCSTWPATRWSRRSTCWSCWRCSGSPGRWAASPRRGAAHVRVVVHLVRAGRPAGRQHRADAALRPQGLLDAVLVRPLSVLGQLLAVDFTVRRVARLAVAATVLALAMSKVDVVWTPARIVVVLITPLVGAAFFAAVFVARATVAFWWIDSGEFANGFTYGGRDFTTYPMTVYSGLFRLLFAYSLGFAFVAYYPALALLGRDDPLGLPAWAAWCSPLVAFVAAALAGIMWRFGVRHYRSTGS